VQKTRWAAVALLTACSGAPPAARRPEASAAPRAPSAPGAAIARPEAASATAATAATAAAPCADARPCGADCGAVPKQIAVGGGHACALAASGDLWCWGDNAVGQLGDGGREPRERPVKVATGVESVAAGDGFTCVLENGGRARCWGALDEPRTATGEQIDRACKAGETPASDLACAARELDKALAERLRRRGIRVPVGPRKAVVEAEPETTPRALTPPITGATSIAAGGDAGCTLDRAGRATCFLYAAPRTIAASIWGSNRLAKPALVKSAADLVEVAPGPLKSCGRTRAGKVLCWSTATDATEVEGISGARGVAMSQEQACAALASGEVRCWSTRHDEAPAAVAGLSRVTRVRGGGFSTMCALTEASDVLCWGRLGDDWFAGLRGALDLQTPMKIPGASGATSLAVGAGHACATTTDGVRCWGSTRRGALGDGFASEVTSPVEVKLGGAAAHVAANGSTTCSALADGRVRCWGHGYASDGRFGGEGPASGLVPGVSGADRVFVGEQTACAIGKGAVSCWTFGGPARAITGIGDALSVAPGITDTCAARASGETACFYRDGPASTLPGVRDLATLRYGASDWSCGRKKAGGMLCWSSPIALPGPTLPAPRLFPIGGAEDAVSVATSALRSCAARADGAVVCVGSLSKTHVAKKVAGFADAVEVELANMGTIGSLLCARTRAGQVSCQGEGRWGELGTGSFARPAFPFVSAVKGISDATGLAVGGEHACALRQDRSVWCWGSDVLGQVTGTARGVRTCARQVPRP
jgi:alpha-tubulin suppressor-like RCC1 family protein